MLAGKVAHSRSRRAFGPTIETGRVAEAGSTRQPCWTGWSDVRHAQAHSTHGNVSLAEKIVTRFQTPALWRGLDTLLRRRHQPTEMPRSQVSSVRRLDELDELRARVHQTYVVGDLFEVGLHVGRCNTRVEKSAGGEARVS